MGISALWTDARELPPEVVAEKYPPIHQNVRFGSYRTALYAIGAVFEVLSGEKARFDHFSHEADSMGGSRTDLELSASACRLVFHSTFELSPSWQGAEQLAYRFDFSGHPGVVWIVEACLASPAYLRMTLTGVDDGVASGVEEVLATCFSSRTYQTGVDAIKAETSRLVGGGYNSLHEWEADFGLGQKAESLNALLWGWFDTEPRGRELLLDFARQLVAEDGPWPGCMAGTLLPHRGKAEIAQLILQSLSSGAFCRDLLTAARGTVALPESWLSTIQAHLQKKNFVERPGFVNIKHLHREVAALLNGAAGTGGNQAL